MIWVEPCQRTNILMSLLQKRLVFFEKFYLHIAFTIKLWGIVRLIHLTYFWLEVCIFIVKNKIFQIPGIESFSSYRSFIFGWLWCFLVFGSMCRIFTATRLLHSLIILCCCWSKGWIFVLNYFIQVRKFVRKN